MKILPSLFFIVLLNACAGHTALIQFSSNDSYLNLEKADIDEVAIVETATGDQAVKVSLNMAAQDRIGSFTRNNIGHYVSLRFNGEMMGNRFKIEEPISMRSLFVTVRNQRDAEDLINLVTN